MSYVVVSLLTTYTAVIIGWIIHKDKNFLKTIADTNTELPDTQILTILWYLLLPPQIILFSILSFAIHNLTSVGHERF